MEKGSALSNFPVSASEIERRARFSHEKVFTRELSECLRAMDYLLGNSLDVEDGRQREEASVSFPGHGCVASIDHPLEQHSDVGVAFKEQDDCILR